MKDFDKIISKISSKDGLTDDESYFSFSYILEGNANEDQIEKFLLGLRERGEKIEEIIVPTLDVTEVKRGKRVQRKKNIFQAMF